MEEYDPITQLRLICEKIRHDSELAVENDFAIGRLAVHAAEFAMEELGFPLHKAASLCVTPLLIHRNMVGVRLCYANFLRENGLEVEAAKEFKEATLAAPTPLHGLALEAHRSSMSQIAPRWHFRMMNDRSRNAAYRLAIQRAIQAMPPGRHTVLDIGAGAGLLGAYCMDAAQHHKDKRVERVLAIESSSALAHTCQRALYRAPADSGSGGTQPPSIAVMNVDSRELDGLPPSDSNMGEHKPKSGAAARGRARLLLSEVLDSGLLGEGVFSTLRQAATRLCEQGAGACQAVPELAIVLATPVECSALRRRTRLALPRGRTPCDLTPASASYLGSCTPSLCEPYCCDRIDAVPHRTLGPEMPVFALAMGACREESLGRARRCLGARSLGHVPVYHVLDDDAELRGNIIFPIGWGGAAEPNCPGSGTGDSASSTTLASSRTSVTQTKSGIVDCVATRFELVLRYDEKEYESSSSPSGSSCAAGTSCEPAELGVSGPIVIMSAPSIDGTHAVREGTPDTPADAYAHRTCQGTDKVAQRSAPAAASDGSSQSSTCGNWDHALFLPVKDWDVDVATGVAKLAEVAAVDKETGPSSGFPALPCDLKVVPKGHARVPVVSPGSWINSSAVGSVGAGDELVVRPGDRVLASYYLLGDCLCMRWRPDQRDTTVAAMVTAGTGPTGRIALDDSTPPVTTPPVSKAESRSTRLVILDQHQMGRANDWLATQVHGRSNRSDKAPNAASEYKTILERVDHGGATDGEQPAILDLCSGLPLGALALASSMQEGGGTLLLGGLGGDGQGESEDSNGAVDDALSPLPLGTDPNPHGLQLSRASTLAASIASWLASPAGALWASRIELVGQSDGGVKAEGSQIGISSIGSVGGSQLPAVDSVQGCVQSIGTRMSMGSGAKSGVSGAVDNSIVSLLDEVRLDPLDSHGMIRPHVLPTAALVRRFMLRPSASTATRGNQSEAQTSAKGSGIGRGGRISPHGLTLWGCLVHSPGIAGTFAVDTDLAAGGMGPAAAIHACSGGMNGLSTDCVHDVHGYCQRGETQSGGGVVGTMSTSMTSTVHANSSSSSTSASTACAPAGSPPVRAWPEGTWPTFTAVGPACALLRIPFGVPPPIGSSAGEASSARAESEEVKGHDPWEERYWGGSVSLPMDTGAPLVEGPMSVLCWFQTDMDYGDDDGDGNDDYFGDGKFNGTSPGGTDALHKGTRGSVHRFVGCAFRVEQKAGAAGGGEGQGQGQGQGQEQGPAEGFEKKCRVEVDARVWPQGALEVRAAVH